MAYRLGQYLSDARPSDAVPVEAPRDRATRGMFLGLDTFTYRWHERGSEILILDAPVLLWAGRRLEIPRLLDAGGREHGFICDGGSVPRFAWPLVGHPFSDLLPAYIHHDYAWSFRESVGLTFDESNEMLHAACLALGCRGARAWAIHKAVSGPVGRAIWKRGAERVGDATWHYGRILPAPVYWPNVLPAGITSHRQLMADWGRWPKSLEEPS